MKSYEARMGTKSKWCHSMVTLRIKSEHLPQFLLSDQMKGIIDPQCPVVTHKGPLHPVLLRKWIPLKNKYHNGEKPVSVSIKKSRPHYIASLLESSHRDHSRWPNIQIISFHWDGDLLFRGRDENMPWNWIEIFRTNWGNTEEITHLVLIQLIVPDWAILFWSHGLKVQGTRFIRVKEWTLKLVSNKMKNSNPQIWSLGINFHSEFSLRLRSSYL